MNLAEILAEIFNALATNQASLICLRKRRWPMSVSLTSLRLSLPFKLFHTLFLIIPHTLLLSFIIPIFPYGNSLWKEGPHKTPDSNQSRRLKFCRSFLSHTFPEVTLYEPADPFPTSGSLLEIRVLGSNLKVSESKNKNNPI